jgi:hypothetical protein
MADDLAVFLSDHREHEVTAVTQGVDESRLVIAVEGVMLDPIDSIPVSGGFVTDRQHASGALA